MYNNMCTVYTQVYTGTLSSVILCPQGRDDELPAVTFDMFVANAGHFKQVVVVAMGSGGGWPSLVSLVHIM